MRVMLNDCHCNDNAGVLECSNAFRLALEGVRVKTAHEKNTWRECLYLKHEDTRIVHSLHSLPWVLNIIVDSS
jgi:hypothetical protein